MKFSALNVDSNSLSIDPLGSMNPPYGGAKNGYPFKTRYYSTLSLIPEAVAISTDAVSRLMASDFLFSY